MSLQELLKKTARTLYLSAWIMPKKTRDCFTIGYLLCRAGDTIADTTLISMEKRLELIKLFPMLIEKQEKATIDIFTSLILPNNKKFEAEKLLLENLPICLSAFNKLPKNQQQDILEVANKVLDAMAWDLTFFPSEDSHLLKAVTTENDTKKYCASMGGAPGKFWAKLLLNGKENKTFTDYAEQIGMSLQITNILRDITSDLQIGRIYLPIIDLTEYNLMPQDLLIKKNYHKMLPIIKKWINFGIDNLENAPAFISQIARYKFFSRASVMWPVLWTLDTLTLIAKTKNLLDSKNKPKISKKTIYLTMFLSPFYACSNFAFNKIFYKKYNYLKNLLK